MLFNAEFIMIPWVKASHASEVKYAFQNFTGEFIQYPHNEI